MIRQIVNQSFDYSQSGKARRDEGFTLIEVMIAASIMIVLSVGVLSVFSYVVKINRGENLRTQAQSVLQQEIEFYRSLKFIPGAQTTSDLPNHRNSVLYAGTHTRPNRTSADGNQIFNITVIVTNLSYVPAGTTDEAHCTLKQIKVEAKLPPGQETGWLANLRTDVTIQRVRSN